MFMSFLFQVLLSILSVIVCGDEKAQFPVGPQPHNFLGAGGYDGFGKEVAPLHAYHGPNFDQGPIKAVQTTSKGGSHSIGGHGGHSIGGHGGHSIGGLGGHSIGGYGGHSIGGYGGHSIGGHGGHGGHSIGGYGGHSIGGYGGHGIGQGHGGGGYATFAQPQIIYVKHSRGRYRGGGGKGGNGGGKGGGYGGGKGGGGGGGKGGYDYGGYGGSDEYGYGDYHDYDYYDDDKGGKGGGGFFNEMEKGFKSMRNFCKYINND